MSTSDFEGEPPATSSSAPPGRRALFARFRPGGTGSALAPIVLRLNARLRALPALAALQDRVALGWERLVEAFCQAAEPALARLFPELRLVAVLHGDGPLMLHRVGQGEATPLGALDAVAPEALAALAATRWSAVELRLPGANVFERRLSLPAASREFLAPIIEHRLERLIPWRPERALYGFRADQNALGDAAATDGAVAVTLTATSRDLVAEPLRRLAAAGLAPTAIGTQAGGPEQPLPVNLLGSAAAAPRRFRRAASRTAFAILGCSLIAFVAAAIAASGATAERDAAAQKLAKARRLLRASTPPGGDGRERAMLTAKQPARSIVVLIDSLSTAIPADTYLKELSVQPGTLRLAGSSGNAPALIGRLEAIGLKNVRFTSAIARDPQGRDEFELGAERPQPSAEASQ